MQEKHAFSLVELSIVLVILGLLAGGILSGQSLIRAAELRSVITDHDRIAAAVNTFKDKYFSLPGDMSNATKFWTAAAADYDTCIKTASTGKKTCDGNGDDTIVYNESYRFWQHLANAGLIEGQYDGITHGTTSWSSTTANSPRGKISNTLWFVWNSLAPASKSTVWFDGDYGNRLSIGVMATNTEPGPFLKAEETWNIDKKIDDGKPGQGILKVQWLNANCVDQRSGKIDSSSLDADYNLQGTGFACFPIFPQAF